MVLDVFHVASTILLQSAHIRSQEIIKRMPEPPIKARLFRIECTVLAEQRALAHNVTCEPAQNRDRTEDALSHGWLWGECLEHGAQLSAADGRNMRHEFVVVVGFGLSGSSALVD